MLQKQRPPATSPLPPPLATPADAVGLRPRGERAPSSAPRPAAAINARGELSRSGKVRSPVA